MWTYDGEEWTQDDASDSTTRKEKDRDTTLPRLEELWPQLQVIEIETPRPNHNKVPPFPNVG